MKNMIGKRRLPSTLKLCILYEERAIDDEVVIVFFSIMINIQFSCFPSYVQSKLMVH
jgi:hypothetical protein